MKDHWTHYLPEGKRIFRDEAAEIIALHERVHKAKTEILQLNREINTKELEISRLAIVKDFTQSEIEEAFDEFKQSEKNNLIIL